MLKGFIKSIYIIAVILSYFFSFGFFLGYFDRFRISDLIFGIIFFVSATWLINIFIGSKDRSKLNKLGKPLTEDEFKLKKEKEDKKIAKKIRKKEKRELPLKLLKEEIISLEKKLNIHDPLYLRKVVSKHTYKSPNMPDREVDFYENAIDKYSENELLRYLEELNKKIKNSDFLVTFSI